MSPELKAFLQKPRPTIEILNELLHYNPDTGELKWKISYSGTIVAGRVAGSTTKCKKGGYVVLEIGGKAYKAHRLAWALYYEKMPPEELVVDHINRVRSDNRINNLRLLTDKLNSQNKKRKHDLPLYVYRHREKFAVRIKTDKMRQYGSFETIEQAVIRRDEVVGDLGIETLEAA